MANVTNPKEYYEKMGFLNIDSLIYSTALIGMLGGVAGISYNYIWPLIRAQDPTAISDLLPYLALLAGSTWAAKSGLDQANSS